MRFFEIVDQILGYYPKADVSILEKAYVFAAKAHKGKARLAKEPYLKHPLMVAGILARMRLDEESIVSGLLHDTLEDHCASLSDVETAFGVNVARIVQGVTRLSRLDFSNRKDHHAEYLRKMILAMSPDIRVLLVKLADRLQDVRSLDHCDAGAQRLMAQETLDIYAPLAARLGIDWMKIELEDLGFKYTDPEAYENMVQRLAKTEEDRLRYIEEVKRNLMTRLQDHDLKGRISGRPKHLYSIYRKMVRQNLDLQFIYDLIAFRVIVDSVDSCYETLAMVHAIWEPVKGRFKDYIVKPKSNMYQSLHTTVLGPHGENMEVQIRTEEMNRIANEGIAAHWMYKEGRPIGSMDEQETQRFSWLRELLEWHKEWRDPKAVFEALKVDFYPEEVYVFTPQGEVKALPRGATPIDFAYEVHTEVGHRCVGGRVNGKLVPLRHELQNGDTIEILTAANQHPSKDWLKFVKSTKALNRIRHWFKAEERERSIVLGREQCEREFRKKGLNFNSYYNSPELMEVTRAFSLRSAEDLLAAVGYRKITPLQVMGRLPSVIEAEELQREDTIPIEKSKAGPSHEGIRVRGADDIMLRMARCCTPVPGEPIIGYITRGKGVTVHRESCRNFNREESDRLIDVQWDSGEGKVYPADIHVVYSGDKGMLAVLSGVLGQLDARVVDLKMEPPAKDLNVCRLRLEVRDTRHLQRVLAALRAERGVYKVSRTME